MPMLIYNIEVSGTAASGTFNFNTKKINSALIKQIIVKAATATTTFNVRIDDDRDNVVFLTDTPATGTLRQELGIPLKGIHTITILDSSADEVFTGKLMLDES